MYSLHPSTTKDFVNSCCDSYIMNKEDKFDEIK